MPKIFSEADKRRHREILLDEGFSMMVERGYRHVTVDQLVQLINVSKGYFYVLFPSKESFFLEGITTEMKRMYEAVARIAEQGLSQEEVAQVYVTLFKQMKFANLEDIWYVSQRVSSEEWARFREFEEAFFTKVLLRLNRDIHVSNPRVVSNLSALIYLFNRSRPDYLFLDEMDETIEVLLDAFHRYIYKSDPDLK